MVRPRARHPHQDAAGFVEGGFMARWDREGNICPPHLHKRTFTRPITEVAFVPTTAVSRCSNSAASMPEIAHAPVHEWNFEAAA
jgi:hypothetical protein